MRFRPTLLTAALAASAASAQAPEPIDTSAVSFLQAETGGDRGQVMNTARLLTELHGARLTGSPQLERAQRWAVETFSGWGIAAEREAWGEFGRGWTLEESMMMAYADGPNAAATAFPVNAWPKAWSPPVEGSRAELVRVDIQSEADFARYRGQLRGRVVMLAPTEPIGLGFESLASRRDADDLLELANRPLPQPPQPQAAPRGPSPEALARLQLTQRRLAFIVGERPLAIIEPSTTDGGSLRVMGASVPQREGTAPQSAVRPWHRGAETVAQFVVMPEHYNRLLRLLEGGQRVRVDLNLDAAFHDGDPTEHNVIAEIPGTDPVLGREVVIIGAHLDSWHSGTGATDNAAGSSVVMEAARALRAFYQQRGQGPRRTIRFALWSGEEQGLFGSVGYVNRRYATSPGFGQPPTAIGPEHDRLSAYYNLDNGTGRIRGVYAQGNAAAAGIFRQWLLALNDSTAQTVSFANTGSTDHAAFDAVGLPGFQFIQDPIAYFGQTWHTSLDTYDHLSEPDLEQAAAVMAVFAHHTAERDERLPRKPLPPTLQALGTN